MIDLKTVLADLKDTTGWNSGSIFDRVWISLYFGTCALLVIIAFASLFAGPSVFTVLLAAAGGFFIYASLNKGDENHLLPTFLRNWGKVVISLLIMVITRINAQNFVLTLLSDLIHFLASLIVIWLVLAAIRPFNRKNRSSNPSPGLTAPCC